MFTNNPMELHWPLDSGYAYAKLYFCTLNLHILFMFKINPTVENLFTLSNI